jgi:Flp pilus assembly protein TadD
MRPLFYNADWLSDETICTHFVVRDALLLQLQDTLARLPLSGVSHHTVLCGARGSGKTTVLRRLAAAVRADPVLRQRLLPLVFSQTRPGLKNLSDFWWHACLLAVEALVHNGQQQAASTLQADRDRHSPTDNALDDAGREYLLSTCSRLGMRPLLLIDALDELFVRLAKGGKKQADPAACALLYRQWSSLDSPAIVATATHKALPWTTEPAWQKMMMCSTFQPMDFTDMLRLWASIQTQHGHPALAPNPHQRIRLRTLFVLCGDNLRALTLACTWLTHDPEGEAASDITHVLDQMSAQYDALLERFSPQAQVIIEALSWNHPHSHQGSFGHTASNLSSHCALPTSTVSAQLDVLDHSGLIEKSAAQGRMQYRLSEPLFRLWIQMRSRAQGRDQVRKLASFIAALEEEAMQLWKESESAQENHSCDSDAPASASIPPQIPQPDTSDPAIWSHWGTWLAGQTGRESEAEAAYRRASTLAPADARTWNNLGALLAYQRHRPHEAEEALRQAINLDPQWVLAWDNLSTVLAEHPERLSEAQAALAQAMRLDPQPDVFWQSNRRRLRIHFALASLNEALLHNNAQTLNACCHRLSQDPEVCALLAHPALIEERLSVLCRQPALARQFLTQALHTGLDNAAAPMWPALYAAIEQMPQCLDTLTPEWQAPAREVYRRLMGIPSKPPSEENNAPCAA